MQQKALCGLAFVGLLGLFSIPSVMADTGTSLGDRNGEGSTQFTGLAQAPEANLFTGALSISIPIEVPPGRKGMTPELRLQYSSSGGPSPFGYGWDLPIGRIERSTKHGVPRCQGNEDEFVLALPGTTAELVNDPPGSNLYRPRIEQSYVLVEKFEAENRWIAHDRAGIKYSFGDLYSARAGTDPNYFMSEDPNGYCRFTTTWALTSVEDPNGNSIQIAWFTFNNVVMPSYIFYGGNAATPLAHVYRVSFGYEQRFPSDYVRSFRNGADTTLYYRLASINVEIIQPAISVIRRYIPTYNDDDPEYEPDGYQSILTAVEVRGSGTSSILPTQHFVYTPSLVGHGTGVSVSAPLLSGENYIRKWSGSGDVKQTLLDMNGDGLLDLVQAEATGQFGWWVVYFGSVDKETGSFSFAPVGQDTTWYLPDGQHESAVRLIDQEQDNQMTQKDTFDITGDGIPDFIDATSVPWSVYPGRMLADGSWGFAAGIPGDQKISWSAPLEFVRWDKSPQPTTLANTFQDTVDMNGDGRPDLVYSDPNQVGPEYSWQVFLNTGTGFEGLPLPRFPAPDKIISNSRYDADGNLPNGGRSKVLVDFNGDGLLDFISSRPCNYYEGPIFYEVGCWDVHLNTGQGFGLPTTLEVPGALGDPQVSSDGDTITDLFDVNGDGLPDLVWVSPGGRRVLLNLGGTFEPVTFMGTNPKSAWATRLWNGLGGSSALRSSPPGQRKTVIDIVDLNGDGLLDRVDARSNPWTVELNQIFDSDDRSQRPNLLTLMENGLGGTSNVIYAPSTHYDHTGGDDAPDLPFINWVVAGIRQNDGFCITPAANVLDPKQNSCIGSGHDLVSEYIYEDGRFDPLSREFRGFRQVTRRQVEDVVGSGMGATANRNDTVTIFGQDDMNKGLVEWTGHYAGEQGPSAPVVDFQDNQWSVRQIVAGSETRWQIWLGYKIEKRHDLDQANQTTYTKNVTDAYGNITHSWRYGANELTDPDRVDTFTEYAIPSGSGVYDRPSRTNTCQGASQLPGCSGAILLEGKTFYYDGGTDGLGFGAVEKGNVKRVVSYSPGISPWVRMTYDAYGNILTTTDPNGVMAGSGGVTSTAYDAYHLYATTTTNALGHMTTTETDYRFGKPTKIIGPNGSATDTAQQTRYDYDEAGRLKCVALPGDTLQSCTTRYDYTFAAAPGQYSTVLVEQKQSPNPVLPTTHYFDALGRKRYTDTLRVVDDVSRTVRVDDVDYDAGGRVRVTYHPYATALGARNNGQTSFDYHLNGSAYIDPLGRVFRTTYSDGTSTRTEYDGALVTSYDQAGIKTERLYDAFERLKKETVFNLGSAYSFTEYTYDGLGRTKTSRQNGDDNTTITNVYDTLGRKMQTTDPDSGTWTYQYDANGNLVMQEDPEAGQHVQMCYDGLNRLKRRCRIKSSFSSMVPCSSSCPSGTAGDSIAYEYDSAGVENSIGYVTRIQDTTGESRIEEYDERGRAMTTTRVINAPSLDLGATDAQMSFTYNEQDQVTSVTYPDNELVHTFYDASGQPIAVSVQGGETLVSDVLYDVFGRILDLEHGNGVADTRTYYGPSKRHRLETLGSASASTTHLALSYPQYTGRGQIERIFDNRDFTTAPLSNEFNYTYDDLGRLKSATGASLIETYDHDALGNLRAKGNLTFQYDTPTTPHLMTSYGVNNGPQGIPIDHDDNGNRKERGDGEQIYEYDPEDRLTFINLTSEHVRFAYDHAGQMTVKAIGDPTATWTRYYNQYAETTNAGKFTKWYYLGGMRVASKTSSDVSWEVVAAAESPVEFASIWQAGRPVLLVALRPEAQVGGGVFLLLVATGLAVAPWRRKAVAGIAVRKGHVIGVAILFTCSTFPWPLMVRPANACTQGCDCPPPEIRHYHHDHLGSTQVITKDNGDIVEQIRYKPYGEIRGRFGPAGNTLTGPTATPRREFTGYDTEMLSGLEYAGARFYDPVLGSFLTQDPMRQFANPYVYAGSDPTNLTDPDGACVLFGFECLTVALVVAAASATAASIDTGIRTGNAGAAIEAGLIAGVTSFAGAYGLGIIAGPAISQLPAVAQYAIALGGGGYGVSQAVDNGYYATAVVGSFAALLAAYGIAQGANGRPGSNGDQLAAMQSELEPAQASGNSVLSDEQVGNIIFNETRSLSGEGIDSARGELGHTIINADETWGSLRSLHAGSAPSSLPSNFSPTLEGGTLQSIRSTVADVRWSRSLGIDPTRGATNFNLRSYPSPRPPSWAPSLRLQAIHGGFSNTIGPPQYIHIWQNPNAGYPFYGL